MNVNRWTDGFMDTMRGVGDPLADATIDALFEEGDIGAVNRMLSSLQRNDAVPEAELPPALIDYLDRTASIPGLDPEKRRRAEAIFAQHGPAILLVLGCYSLPAAYAAQKGVQVLHRTAQLIDRPVQRLLETAQMVNDVMAKGALEPAGRGLRTAQKVRLVHAAVRRHLRRAGGRPWDPALGVPINQEDMAGTLMTFSYVVLEGLTRLGIRLGAEDQEAYLHTWIALGGVLGVDARLLPADMREARALTALIRRRQIGGSPEGRELAAALMRGFDSMLPGPLAGLGGSLIHYFLGADPFLNEDVAALLGIAPSSGWTRWIPRAIAGAGSLGRRLAAGSPALGLVTRHLSRRFVETLVADRFGARASFAIPGSIAAARAPDRRAAGEVEAPLIARCPVHRLLPRAA